MPAEILCDVSRLLSRVLHATPTGVDRVEMAYARGLRADAAARLQYVAVHPSGLYGRLPNAAVLRFLDRTEQRWASDDSANRLDLRRSALRVLAELRPRRVPSPMPGKTRVYVQSSPHHLTRPALVARVLAREQARLICMIHDLIPLEYPEYARPGGAALHRVRVETIARHADGIIANSNATLASLKPWIDRAGRRPLVQVAHLGTWQVAMPSMTSAEDGRPYFLCVATIEPRKNHLLLLHLWRRLAELHGSENVPKLVLVGRRGWENEQVVDLLERCPALKGCVEEYCGLPDSRVLELLRGARALLLPSFAEGYGMPVAEALDAGVPVICSDLLALREAGGDVPDYLDPLDGPAWLRAVLDYAAPQSERRAAQMDRLPEWAGADWRGHFNIVMNMVEQLSA